MSNKDTMTAIVDGILDFIGYLLVVTGCIFFFGMSFVIGLPSLVAALENAQNGESVTFLQAFSLGGAIFSFVVGFDLGKRLSFGSSRD